MNPIDTLSEKIERSALESLHACCPTDTKQKIGLDLIEVEDGIAACASKDPSILVNRTLGLGTQKPVSTASIEAVRAIYADRNIANYFLHIYQETLPEDSQQLLSSDSFVKKRGWMKFQSGKPEPREAKTKLRVEQIGAEHSLDFGKIVCGAFGMQEDSAPMLAGLVNDDRWKLFVSFDGDKPAGAGALFVEGNAGWLEWGATHPDFRSRGSQASIMAARLNLARELNCEHLFTETGEAVEGDAQHSYKNILKAGFSESVLRLNYAPNKV